MWHLKMLKKKIPSQLQKWVFFFFNLFMVLLGQLFSSYLLSLNSWIALLIVLYLICHLLMKSCVFILSLTGFSGALEQKESEPKSVKFKVIFISRPAVSLIYIPLTKCVMQYRRVEMKQGNCLLKHLHSRSGNALNAFGKHGSLYCCSFPCHVYSRNEEWQFSKVLNIFGIVRMHIFCANLSRFLWWTLDEMLWKNYALQWLRAKS